MLVLPFISKDERDKIIKDQALVGLTLTEERNITEGNFLVFSDGSEAEPKTEIDLLQEDNASLWYKNMVQSAKVESNETEVAGLWYSLMMGGI